MERVPQKFFTEKEGHRWKPSKKECVKVPPEADS